MSEKLFDENGVPRINLQDYEVVHNGQHRLTIQGEKGKKIRYKEE